MLLSKIYLKFKEFLVLRFLIDWWSVHLVDVWLFVGRRLVFFWLVGKLSVIGGFKKTRDSSCSLHLEHCKCGTSLIPRIAGFKGKEKRIGM